MSHIVVKYDYSLYEEIIKNNIPIVSNCDIKDISFFKYNFETKLYLANLFDKKVILKSYNKVSKSLFINECKINMLINHPCIPFFYGIYFSHGKVMLVFEYIDGILFNDYVNNIIDNSIINQYDFDSDLITKYKIKYQELSKLMVLLYQIINIISYLHSLDIIHRDIKPNNIIIYNDIAYLIDFGCSISNDSKNELKRGTFGTYKYMAPEVIKVSKYYHTNKIDIYSISIMILELIKIYNIDVKKLNKYFINCTDKNPLRRPNSSVLLYTLTDVINYLQYTINVLNTTNNIIHQDE